MKKTEWWIQMDNFPDNTLLSFMISPLAVPYIFFIYLLTYVFNFPFLILLHSLVYKRSVHNENEGRLGRGGGERRKCTTLKVLMLCPLVLLVKIDQKKEQWNWKSWGDGKWNVGESSREIYLSMRSKFRIMFRRLDYEEIFRNLWSSVWAKI